MILTEDTIEGKKKNPITVKGERTKASEFFAGLASKQEFLISTVFLATATGNASGIIFAVNKQANKAYLLTAKHSLYTLAGKKSSEGKKPSEYLLNTYAGGIKITYAPANLLSKPASGPALVTGIHFLGLDDSTWTYDVVVLEATDNDFVTYVKNNRFITKDNVEEYQTLLARSAKGGFTLLDKKTNLFLQMGYGVGKDPDWVHKIDPPTLYKDYAGYIQCKKSEPTAAAPKPGEVFEVDKTKKPADWPTTENICELLGSDTNSTAPGDSGGPLFAIPKDGSNTFYLVGVTSGANLFSDQKYKTTPSTAPGDEHILNNGATYVDTLFDNWDWTNIF